MLTNDSQMKTEKEYYFNRIPFIGYRQTDRTGKIYLYQLIGSTLADMIALCEDPLRGLREIRINFQGRDVYARRRIDDIKVTIIDYEKQQ